MKTKCKLGMLGVLFCWAIFATGQEPAPAAVKAPYAGATITDFRGKVGIRLPGQALAAPLRGSILPPETEVNTDDGHLLLRLADGSDVLVRSHTRLTVKQPDTSGWRYLQLMMGRIQTQIQKHLGSTPPVQIGTPSAVISVRGTRFDVEVDRRGFTEVDVEEGVVELESASGRGSAVLVTAGFSSRVGMESGPEAPRPTRDLRPQLDRPGRHEGRDIGDDDPMKRLEAADPERHGGEHEGTSSGGTGSEGGESSGSDGGSKSGDSGGHSGSDGGRSGSDGGDRSDGDHHGGKPPV
jgi:hypothetical protein